MMKEIMFFDISVMIVRGGVVHRVYDYENISKSSKSRLVKLTLDMDAKAVTDGHDITTIWKFGT